MVDADAGVWEDDCFPLTEETAGVVGNKLNGDAGWPARVAELPLNEDADVPPVGPKNDGCLSGPSFEVVESKPNKFRLTHGVVGWLAGRTLYDHRG